MKYIILGLISLKSMSGYELGKFIENNLALICSSSAGSIQTALKKLLELEMIKYDEIVENGKLKKYYFITNKGKQEFSNWLKNPMQVEKVKNMELSKLFFLGFSDKNSRVESIENYIEQLNKVKESLKIIESEMIALKEVALREIEDENSIEILTYQLYTLKYGIDSVEFEIKWYTDLLRQMEA